MSDYYGEVATYFDDAAHTYEERYWSNHILQRMRQVFREEVKRHSWASALEVGCGPGIDIVHFATIFPDRMLAGIDLAPQMVARAQERIARSRVGNALVEIGSVETPPTSMARETFDLCYVFFGALNTTKSLHLAADRLYHSLRPGGHLILTVVNRSYIAEFVISLLRLRWKTAFARLRRVWPGYAPEHPLPSRCFSPAMVERAFGRAGELIRHRGLCITYPAWYRQHIAKRLGWLAEPLWQLDAGLTRTPAWHFGEYALYVYRKGSAT